MRTYRSVLVSLAIPLVLAVPSGATARRLLIGGSTSVLPLAQKLALAYHRAYPRSPAPSVSGGQSDVGISGAANGQFDIGDSSRDPIPGVDPHGLVFTKIARDGICVVTNPANAIASLSQESVEKIFTGSVRDWSEVPGSQVSGPIELFDHDAASGTQDAFQHIFLGQALKISPTATEESSNGLEQSAVASPSHKGAIGFVSFAYTAGVNPVGYQGIPCTLASAKSGQYVGVRNFWMVTKGAPTGEAAKFINWVTSGNRVSKALISSSWIPIH